MLLWGLAGFVNPVKSVQIFENALGIQVQDEFFKDNAIEVRNIWIKLLKLNLKSFQSGGTLMFWAVMGFFYFLLNIL